MNTWVSSRSPDCPPASEGSADTCLFSFQVSLEFIRRAITPTCGTTSSSTSTLIQPTLTSWTGTPTTWRRSVRPTSRRSQRPGGSSCLSEVFTADDLLRHDERLGPLSSASVRFLSRCRYRPRRTHRVQRARVQPRVQDQSENSG